MFRLQVSNWLELPEKLLSSLPISSVHEFSLLVRRGTLHPAAFALLSYSLVVRPQPQAGFVLPLALSASAVLLLGSASIHTLSLQKRLRVHASSQREQVADQLRSAAQAFAVATRGPEACLLQWSSLEWASAAQDCSGSDSSRLSRGLVGEMPWSLLDWQPFTESGQLRLQLADGRTGSFRLALDPLVPAVLGISEVQLQARGPQLEAE